MNRVERPVFKGVKDFKDFKEISYPINKAFFFLLLFEKYIRLFWSIVFSSFFGNRGEECVFYVVSHTK